MVFTDNPQKSEDRCSQITRCVENMDFSSIRTAYQISTYCSLTTTIPLTRGFAFVPKRIQNTK